MEKSEIVNKFLEQGFLISPGFLDQLTEEKINLLLPTLKTKNTLVLSQIEEPETAIPQKHTEPQKKDAPTLSKPEDTEITFTIKKSEQPKNLSVKDFVQYYNNKYTILKNILCTKLNPVSINKLSNIPSATVIGLISEKITQGYLIEDPTGKLEIIYEKHLPKNSVFGFTGDIKEGKMIVTAVSCPDIPLDKKIKTSNLNLSFYFEKGSPLIKANKTKEIKDFKLPAAIKVSKASEINILVFKPETQIKKTEAIEFLKFRCLPETTAPNENHIISEEPDIFWIIQKDSWSENYKGVTIISGESAEIDPNNREIKL
ncbi:MAG TPA: hypothetical protein VJB06_02170 [archaeon]|nr:hypothetical protein [archaeon]